MQMLLSSDDVLYTAAGVPMPPADEEMTHQIWQPSCVAYPGYDGEPCGTCCPCHDEAINGGIA